ncbi:MAG: NAD(P)H-binding protein, partial [Acidimicrobiia bacterium]|nr:NAD(P)H-binding protein [Acidimicrobiia bacterium]
MRIAVAGATGYIGSRLVPQLLDAGHEVVCLARTPGKLDYRSWRDAVELRQCDVLDADQVAAALEGTDAAYYLVHSMGSGGDFAAADRTAAANFADAA